MQLTSMDFGEGGWIPSRFTCDGENISPQLSWLDAPSQTHSFALVCADHDAPSGVWYHWALYDLPPSVRELAADWPLARRLPPQAINDFGRPGYSGPCPPRGAGPHRYYFTLYALSTDRLALPNRVLCREVEAGCKSALAYARLMGRYRR